jgi:hypothetical protein
MSYTRGRAHLHDEYGPRNKEYKGWCLGVAPAGFEAGSGPSIPAPFSLTGLIFYQTRDPIGFGAPTGTRLVPIFCV